MSAHLYDWLMLVVRWLHLLFGAAWIGTSFYFVWLNNHVRPTETPSEPEVKGEVWSVHGGAFYRVLKYDGTPRSLPKTLHWFYWDAYLTWATGTALLLLVYWMRPSVYMVDPAVMALSPAAAIGIGVGTIVLGWLVYDGICRSPLGKSQRAMAAVGLPLLVGLIYFLTHTIGARAAYLHFGALLGTIMAGNVFFVIIPGQRIMVAQMMAGEEPDTSKGAAGAMRSLHNNYFTLPVLFVMISTHYPITYGHPMSWAILVALSLIGATYRHSENLKEQGHGVWWIAPLAAAALVALAFVSKSGPSTETSAQAVTFTEVHGIVARRCTPCHAAAPTHPAFPEAPKGVILETPDQIVRQVDAIHAQAVVSKVMPLGNLTQMTDAERGQLRRWIEDGAAGP